MPKALADLRRLWGINAPENINVAAPPENPYADLTREELRQKLMGLTQILMWETSPVPSQAPAPEDSLEARKAAYAAVLERRKQSAKDLDPSGPRWPADAAAIIGLEAGAR